MKRTVETLGLLGLACWCSLPAAAQETDPPCRHPDLDHAAFVEGEWRVPGERVSSGVGAG